MQVKIKFGIYIINTEEFYNLQGGLVIQLNPKQATTTVDVSRFHKGLFLVRIITKNKVFNYKIVVE